MHISKTALFLIFAVLSVTAQQTPDRQEACKQCLVTARIKQVPACEGITATPRTSNSHNSTMTPKERTCHCGAADSDAWISSCTSADICDKVTAGVLSSMYELIKLSCTHAGVSSTSDAGRMWSSSASRNGLAAGAAVAVATVFGAFL